MLTFKASQILKQSLNPRTDAEGAVAPGNRPGAGSASASGASASTAGGGNGAGTKD